MHGDRKIIKTSVVAAHNASTTASLESAACRMDIRTLIDDVFDAVERVGTGRGVPATVVVVLDTIRTNRSDHPQNPEPALAAGGDEAGRP